MTIEKAPAMIFLGGRLALTIEKALARTFLGEGTEAAAAAAAIPLNYNLLQAGNTFRAVEHKRRRRQ